ncbi:HI0074 family nucleotidyltransferase substrate-binding subunit [uncultured Megasphaera sp.]|uniref:HI0074 family nucleotidyltransferase substrate-binding subunit n=1 Tax=uncultured Megasphaera sp. TaxID=165188 RepID=UPI0028688698|nr:HI0074 family nucleotidyltransferase substrate-binding subunit [uncultured Megasphaera sp.]
MDYQTHLQLLQQAKEQDLSNPFICHGIIHLFQEQFDLALDILRDHLKREGKGMAAMGSAKELIAEAYENYLYIDEDCWLAMLKDRRGSRDEVGIQVQRILDTYLEAFAALV